MFGLPPLSQTTIQNVAGELKSHIMRQYGAALLSTEFMDWLKSKEEGASHLKESDMRLLKMIKAQEKAPLELLKVQRAMAGRLKRVPKSQRPWIANLLRWTCFGQACGI